MFSFSLSYSLMAFPKISYQTDTQPITEINSQLKDLNQLISQFTEGGDFQSRRRRVFVQQYIDKVDKDITHHITLKDRLLNLGYAAQSVGLIGESQAAQATSALDKLASQFMACPNAMLFQMDQFSKLARIVSTLLKKIEGIEKPSQSVLTKKTVDQLTGLRNQLTAFQAELIVAMKMYLEEAKNEESTIHKGLIYHFAQQVSQVIHPNKKLLSSKYKLALQKELSKLPNKQSDIDGHFLYGDYFSRDTALPEEQHDDKTLLKQELINCIDEIGSDADRDYLYQNGYKVPNYSYAVNKLVKQGKDAVMQVAHPFSELRKVWLAQRWMNKNLTVNPQQHETGQPANIDYLEGMTVTRFMGFNDAVEFLLKKYPAMHGFNAFSDENKQLLKALCNRLQLAGEGHFYTSTELTQLIRANELSVKHQAGAKLSFDDINVMKEGVKIKVRYDKHHALLNRLAVDDDKNIFNILKAHPDADEKQRHALTQLELTWKKRSRLASLSSPSLFELSEHLDKLNSYSNLLKEEFGLNDKTYLGGWHHWMKGITLEHKQIAAQLVKQFDQLIQNGREAVVQAMLERLALVPSEHFSQLNSPGYKSENNATLYQDDVLFATLEALAPMGGISLEHLNRFKQEGLPQQTLNDDLIRRFNMFIRAYGNEEQCQALEDLYVQAHHHLPDDVFNVLPQDDVVLSQDDVALRQDNVALEDSVNWEKIEGYQSLDNSFTFIGGSSTTVPTDNDNKVKDELSDSWSSLTNSWVNISNDTKLDESFVVTDDASLKIDLDPLTLALADREFVNNNKSSKKDRAVRVQARRYFNDRNNQMLYVEIMNQFIKEGTRDSFELMSARAYEEVAKIILAQEGKEKNLKLNEKEFIYLAKHLAKNHFATDAAQGSFEKCVIDRASEQVIALQHEKHRIKGSLEKDRISPDAIQPVLKRFSDFVCFHLVKNQFTNQEEAFAYAHLDLFLNRILNRNTDASPDFQVQFRRIATHCILQNKDWYKKENRHEWKTIITNTQALMEAKASLLSWLQAQHRRIKEERFNFLADKSKTQKKLTLLGSYIIALDKINDFKELARLEKKMGQNPFFALLTQNRRKDIFCFFGSSVSTTGAEFNNFDKTFREVLKNTDSHSHHQRQDKKISKSH